jgi:hypothetical protein
MPTEGITLLAVLLIAAFVVERITAGVMFVLTLLHILPDPDVVEDPVKRARARKRCTLYHFLLSSLFVIPVLLSSGEFRFLDALGLGGRSDLGRFPLWLDHAVLGIVLIGGSEQMSAFLKMVGSPAGAGQGGSQPVEVSGRLMLDESPGKK